MGRPSRLPLRRSPPDPVYTPTDMIEIREEGTAGKSMMCFIDHVATNTKGIEKGCSVISVRSSAYEFDLN